MRGFKSLHLRQKSTGSWRNLSIFYYDLLSGVYLGLLQNILQQSHFVYFKNVVKDAASSWPCEIGDGQTLLHHRLTDPASQGLNGEAGVTAHGDLKALGLSGFLDEPQGEASADVPADLFGQGDGIVLWKMVILSIESEECPYV